MANIVFSQKKKQNIECGFFGTKTIEERSKIFPFNEAKKILLIAFPNGEPPYILNKERETIEAKDSLDYTQFGYKIEKVFSFKSPDSLRNLQTYIATKVVTVEGKTTEDLSNILFNYKLRINRYPVKRTDVKCYTPRHAVLFLDKDDKVVSVFEICFECHKYYMFPFSKDIVDTLGAECDKRLDFFKEIFIKNGFEIKER